MKYFIYVEKIKMKKKIDWERKLLEWSYVFFMIAAFTWWCLFLGVAPSVNRLEKTTDNLHEQVMNMRQVDREKCIDLFLKDEI